MASGVRVLRGPHWDGDDMDGGEGHLGTLVEVLSDDNSVRVLWDNGNESTCKAGKDGKFELRIFDTAQAGVRHPNTICAVCNERHVFGILWRCTVCPSVELCSLCYSEDEHDIRHEFSRFDNFQSTGTEVKKRKVSVRMRSMGLFKGAKVTRGKDWEWEDQDGGQGSQGEIEAFETIDVESRRNLVRVRWPNDFTNIYRVGHKGHVDLKCIDEGIGTFYYRDHLPVLDASNFPLPLAPQEAFAVSLDTPTSPSASSATPNASPTSSSSSGISISAVGGTSASSSSATSTVNTDDVLPGGEESRGLIREGDSHDKEEEKSEALALGDKVVIAVDEDRLKELQKQFGGCTQGMVKRIGQTGEVAILPSETCSAITVKYSEKQKYRFNPEVLIKVTTFDNGDVVRIRWDVDQVKFLNKNLNWNPDMAKACGKVGKVTRVNANGTVTIRLGSQSYEFTAASCVPAVGARPEEATANTEGAGKAVWTAGSDNKNNDDSSTADEDAADIAYRTRMMELLFGGALSGNSDGSDSKSTDPEVKVLFLAISNEETQTVEKIVRGNRSLLTKEYKKMTPLMYACHSGKREMLELLLGLGADINARSENGDNALMSAIEGEEDEIAVQLLGMGADASVQNNKQRTPLHSAAFNNMIQTLQLLICMDADVNVKDKYGDTPLFDAIEKNRDDVVEILLQVPQLNYAELNGRGYNMIHLACYRGRTKQLEMMLTSEKHPPVDELLLGEYTALHIAAINDHVECVGLLVLIGGADVNFEDRRRHATPLHLACKRWQINTVKCLIGLGANVNARDINGSTPLHLALGKRYDESMVLDSGSDREISARIRIAHLLLENGAMPDIQDNTDNVPLFYGKPEVQAAVLGFLDQMKASAATVNTNTEEKSEREVTDGKLPVDNECEPTAPEDLTANEILSPTENSLMAFSGSQPSPVVMPTEEQHPASEEHPVKEEQHPASEEHPVKEEQHPASEEHPVKEEQHPATHVTGDLSTSTNVATGADDIPAAVTFTAGAIDCATGDITPEEDSKAVQQDASCCKCGAKADVTLLPCEHKCVCHKCCEVLTQCPVCDVNIEELEPDNTDDQDDAYENILMNK